MLGLKLIFWVAEGCVRGIRVCLKRQGFLWCALEEEEEVVVVAHA